jgi:hypothetical protein
MDTGFVCQQFLPKAGLASLLNPYKIFDGNYHSMDIELVTVCDASRLEPEQSVSLLMVTN